VRRTILISFLPVRQPKADDPADVGAIGIDAHQTHVSNRAQRPDPQFPIVPPATPRPSAPASDRTIVPDDENPEWTADDFARARPAAEVLPPEVLAAFGRKRGQRKLAAPRNV
jgi:hypothetical protein